MEGLWRRVGFSGPLLPYVAGFAEYLAAQGYAERTVDETVRLASHLSRWLADRDHEAGALTPDTVERFLRARREAGARCRSARALTPLLAYLRSINVVAAPMPAAPTTAVERLLEVYRAYLVRERGMVQTTVRSYSEIAHKFLLGLCPDGELDIDELTAAGVVQAALSECCRGRSVAGGHWLSGLRCLLRFLVFEGRIPNELVGAIPDVPRWRDASLPRAVKPDGVARLLAACDGQTAAGRRDLAIITLLVRLGLRSMEVSNLRLDDIDWRHGEITVQSKGRCEQLPLPWDVGKALVACLRDRPSVPDRHIFLTRLAPIVGLGPSGVRDVVKRACRRADMPRIGAHRLRHTAATRMLNAGASLSEVGQVLRHSDLQTTAGYAKVDHINLRPLARPWPGSLR